MVFLVVVCGSENWSIKKAECWRIDAFELWCWRRLLRGLWTARRSNQSILKKISPEYSLEGLMLHLKLQYFGHLMRSDTLKRPWRWERLRAGGKGGNRGWDGWIASPTQWTWVWVNSGLMMDREDWHAAIHGIAKVGHDWGTELNWMLYQFKISPSAHTNSSCYLFSTNTLSFNPFWWFEQYFAVVFIYISLVIDEVEYLSIFLSVIWISSALKCLFKSFTYFSTILSFSC